MRSTTLLFLTLLFSAVLAAQSPITVGSGGMQTTALEEETGADVFATVFDESNVGFLHIYVDPNPDPLATYLLRGREMSDTAVSLLPPQFKKMAKSGKIYSTMAVKGVDENLYITRLDGPRRDQIDMFAIRDGKVKHLKTLAYLECTGKECDQMDSYITDVNLDTKFDLIQIARRSTEASGATDERRSVYTMMSDTRRWRTTDELDVPWEGITFYNGEEEEDER